MRIIYKCRYCLNMVRADDAQPGDDLSHKLRWHKENCLPGAIGIMDPVAIEPIEIGRGHNDESNDARD